MKNRIKNYLWFLVMLIFAVSLVVTLHYFTPSQIVAKIGVRNSYAILFFISAVGGSSLITASSYYVFIPIFAIAGLNPILLGIIGGVGVTLGDVLYFYLGARTKEISPEEIGEKFERANRIIARIPAGVVPLFVYVYAMTPLPNDVVTFSLGLVNYPFRKIIFPLVLGNITITVVMAYLALFGMSLF